MPFHPSEKNFSLSGELVSKGCEIIVEFCLSDPKNLFELPNSFIRKEPLSKQEGLWQSTCFEVFLSPLGHSQYYEFNFALTPAWNVYVFDAYREPQPPRGTADFALKEMHWNKQQSQLTVKLESTTRLPLFQASLTAVLEEKNSKKHYCALTHRGLKPDFHLRESFTLLRGEKK